VNYTKLLEISSFFIWHIFLEVSKTQNTPSKIWQTAGDALTVMLRNMFCISCINASLRHGLYLLKQSMLHLSCLSSNLPSHQDASW